MPEIRKIVKIKKQEYKFELRKKYFNKKKFKIRERRPIDVLVAGIRGSLFPKKAAPGGGKKPLVTIGVFALLLAAFFFLLLSPAKTTPVEENITPAAPKLRISVNGSGIASSGALVADKRTAYFRLAYSAEGADSVSVKTSIYSERIPNQVFILASRMDEATTYPKFRQALGKRLGAKGFALNDISLWQLETLPEGAMLIVPSGLVPEKLIGEGNANIASIAKRGVNIVYIGQKFDFFLSESGSTRKISQEALSKLPFTFEVAALKPNGELFLSSSLYKVRTTRTAQSALLYGMISKGKVGNGTVLFVPQTLDGGWGGIPEHAAADIEKIITEMKWTDPEAEQETEAEFAENRTFHSFFFSPAFSEREKTLVVRVVASSAVGGGGTAAQQNRSETEKMRVLYPRSDVNGDLFFITGGPGTVSGKVTRENTNFIVMLNENSSEKRNLFISIENVSGEEAQPRHSIAGSSAKVELLGSTQFAERLDLDEGIYLASIVDEAKNAYARALVVIADAEFSLLTADWTKGIFRFAALADGKQVKIKKLRVSVNGKYNYSFTAASEFTIDLEDKLRGQPLPDGAHTFDFEFNEIKKRITLSKPEGSNPLLLPILGVLLAGGLAFGAVYLGALMRKTEYALDIPDFPPLALLRIPVKKDAVLGIMEKVNEDYRWKNTPLRLEEIKKGFKKIIYQGKPVFISDYNLEYILDELKNKNEVKSALNYFGLSKWEKETGKTMAYLAVQRKVRDICINEAIPFSRPGESNEYDMLLKVLGQNVFVYIVEDAPVQREEKLSLALRVMPKGLVVLLFENSEGKKDFEDTINSASESTGVIKMEIMSGSINPLTINEFEKMLKEMKSI